MSDFKFEKRALELYEAGQPVVAEWHRKLAEGIKPVPSTGRKLADADPKRGAESPLGGRVW